MKPQLNKRILWIEDDALILRDILVPLEDEGFEVDIVNTYSDYLTKFNKPATSIHSYDVILLDLLLPLGDYIGDKDIDLNHSGIALNIIEDIRFNQKSSVPIIILSGCSDLYEDIQIERYGEGHILVAIKPTLPSILQSMVHDVLRDG